MRARWRSPSETPGVHMALQKATDSTLVDRAARRHREVLVANKKWGAQQWPLACPAHLFQCGRGKRGVCGPSHTSPQLPCAGASVRVGSPSARGCSLELKRMSELHLLPLPTHLYKEVGRDLDPLAKQPPKVRERQHAQLCTVIRRQVCLYRPALRCTARATHRTCALGHKSSQTRARSTAAKLRRVSRARRGVGDTRGRPRRHETACPTPAALATPTS